MSNDHRTDISDEDVVKLYNDGQNYRQIANRFKTGSKIIIRRLIRNGIEVVKLSNQRRQDLDDGEIIKMYLDGKSAIEIAKLVGTNKGTILYRLRENSIERRQTIRDDIDTEELIRLYIDEKLSTVKIAKLYGVTSQMIKTRLKNHNISRRTKVEAGDLISRRNTCVICGTIFRPVLTNSTKGHGRKTCSKECRSKLMHDVTIHDTGHSQAFYQRISRELKPRVCEICGAVPPTRLDTHHVDRDHHNNTSENLRVLCMQCHSYLHYVEDKRGLRGWEFSTDTTS